MSNPPCQQPCGPPKAGRAQRAEPAETDVAAETGQDQKSQNIITRYVTDWHVAERQHLV